MNLSTQARSLHRRIDDLLPISGKIAPAKRSVRRNRPLEIAQHKIGCAGAKMERLRDAEQCVGAEQPVRNHPGCDYRGRIRLQLPPARFPRKVVAPAATAVSRATQPLQLFDAEEGSR